MVKVLKKGANGYFVTQWQDFLRGQGYLVNSSGVFDDDTVSATMQFQKKYKMQVDGVVGNQSLGRAALLGFEIVEYSETEKEYPRKTGKKFESPTIGTKRML